MEKHNWGDSHTEQVDAMFGEISPKYDFYNHFFSLGVDYWWRYCLIKSVVPGPTCRVLDMAAGTLDVSLALLRRYSEISVVAADICEPMLEYGKKKIRAEEAGRIQTQVMDAREIPFPDASFDAVTIAFGIRNIKPREDALREMYRVLVPGGRLCILEFAPVSLPVVGPAYHWYIENIMPRIVGLFCDASPYKYLAKTIADFPKPKNFSEEIRSCGFPFVQFEPLTLGIANLHVAIKA